MSLCCLLLIIKSSHDKGKETQRGSLGGSPGHCVFVCSGSEEIKGRGKLAFVAKTIEVMVRLAPSHRGAPGILQEGFCVLFSDQPTWLYLHAKLTLSIRFLNPALLS